MNSVLLQIQKIGIVPVIAIDKKEDAVLIAKALIDGGLSCAEITFRTDAAEESIKAITKEFPEMLVGAGTVTTKEQVDKAIAAGAKFIVSPGFNPKIVEYCIEKGIGIVPGCVMPSDIERAMELGLEVLKFFPAEAVGGLNMIKSLIAPYTNIKFMPTGGIGPKNLISYLDVKQIIACGGSWMVSKDIIKEQRFEEITKLTKEAVELMLGFKIKHVGINAKDEKEAEGIASSFENIFGFMKKVGNSSIFAGDAVEVMKSPYLGANGHIAIETNYIDRAIYHLESKGFTFDTETTKYDKDKNMIAIYLKGEIGGFAVHLVQKK